MENLLGKVEINDIEESFEQIFANNLNVEFALPTSDKFDNLSWQKIIQRKKYLSLIKVIHLPFFGLNLGSKEIEIRTISKNIIKRGIDISLKLNVRKGVLHTGYIPLIPKVNIPRWLDNFYFELESLLEYSSKNNFIILLENTYEKNIDLFVRIFNKFENKNLKICLDIGHINCFSEQSFETWFNFFKNNIAHFHLSDNNGKDDNHFELGKGNVDYSLLPFNDKKCSFTLETKPNTWQGSINYLKKVNPFFKEIF